MASLLALRIISFPVRGKFPIVVYVFDYTSSDANEAKMEFYEEEWAE